MRGPSAVTRGSTLWVFAGLAERHSTARQPREPQQSACLAPQAQVHLAIAWRSLTRPRGHQSHGVQVYHRVKPDTMPPARVSRKRLHSRARLTLWVADGADRAPMTISRRASTHSPAG
jgi:hypothetical protein